MDKSWRGEAEAESWFAANRLSLNADKTVHMFSSTRSLDSFYNNPTKVKFLGVHLDPKLLWNEHGECLASKLASSAFALRQLSRCVSGEVLRMASFALFHSKMSYAILVWGHSSSRYRLFRLQRRAVRIVAGVGYREDCRSQFRLLGILTLPSVFALESLCYVRVNSHLYTRPAEYHIYDTRNRDN